MIHHDTLIHVENETGAEFLRREQAIAAEITKLGFTSRLAAAWPVGSVDASIIEMADVVAANFGLTKSETVAGLYFDRKGQVDLNGNKAQRFAMVFTKYAAVTIHTGDKDGGTRLSYAKAA